jgi:hypothetical protein
MNHLHARQKVLHFVNQTRQSIFLTGKAGTGKTTLLNEIKTTTHKSTVVVAPTGIAALNAGGVTIHSMFQLPLSSFVPTQEMPESVSTSIKVETQKTLIRHHRMNRNKRTLLTQLELLIIDEVSMLRADVLDAIDFTLRAVRKNRVPFGGVQVLMVGDLMQLPPVVKHEEWHVLKKYYEGMYFFNAKVIQEMPPVYIELEHIFRQQDKLFIDLLNNLRNNKINHNDIAVLKDYVQPDFNPEHHEGYITLTTHNATADDLNSKALEALKGKSYQYQAAVKGNFPEHLYPLEEVLTLKKGAQVMFIKNDANFEKRYYNGKIGKVLDLTDENIIVEFPEEQLTINVEKYTWQNIKYETDPNTKEISEEVLGIFEHFPLKLAWAITVHKSQGLTFDKAVLDVSRVFLPGQAYVALSRLRSLEGLVLKSPIQLNGIQNAAEVVGFASNKSSEEELESKLQEQTSQFLLDTLIETFSWKPLYQQWRNHRFSYNEHAAQSEKSAYYSWAVAMEGKVLELEIPAERFKQQLRAAFAKETTDYEFINSRIAAAVDYFSPIHESVLKEIAITLIKLESLSRVKEFTEELMDLEESHHNILIKLHKTKQFAKAVYKGVPLDKKAFDLDDFKQKHLKLKEEIKQELLKQGLDFDKKTKTKKPKSEPKKKNSTPKIPTTEITYALWKELHSIEDIAERRALNPQTIMSHLGKLITENKIQIDEVLPQETINSLEKAFQKNRDKTVGEIKQLYGDKFEWGELRMYEGFFKRQLSQ